MTSKSGGAFGKERRSAQEASGPWIINPQFRCRANGWLSRAQWALLPHIGYYCDDTEMWRWYMRPARWLFLALGKLPRSNMFQPMYVRSWVALAEDHQRDYERLVASGEIPTRASRRSSPSAQSKPGTRLPTHPKGET